MKRIIDGKAYNTDTAQAIARYTYTLSKTDDEAGPNKLESVQTLYRTKGGAFFVTEITTPIDALPRETGCTFWSPIRYEGLTRIDYDVAYKFVRQAGVELLAEGIFPSVPEADDREQAG